MSTSTDPAPALALEGLTKCYGAVQALSGLSLSVAAGEVVGLLGPNGAGKTTALRIVLGLLTADAGRVRVAGRRADRCARRQIGYLPGEVRFPVDQTGGELLAFLGRFHADLDPAYRARLVERLELDPSKRFGAYSRGNRQKLGIVAALQHRPRLAILDEPSTGLDPLIQRAFYALIAEAASAGAAVLFSSHVLGEVQSVCDRVAVLRGGALVFDQPKDALEDQAVRRVEVVFETCIPDDASLAVPGEVRRERDGDRLRLWIEARQTDALVKALARHAVRDLVVLPPSLEDLFLSFYEDGA